MKLLISILLLSSSFAYANVSETGKVTRVLFEGTAFASVWLDGTDATTDCPGGARWSVPSSDALFDAKVSLLMTAIAQGRTIRLLHATSWGCSGPLGDANRIYSIDISL